MNQSSRNLGPGRRESGGSQLSYRGLNYLDPQNMARINRRHKRSTESQATTSSLEAEEKTQKFRNEPSREVRSQAVREGQRLAEETDRINQVKIYAHYSGGDRSAGGERRVQVWSVSLRRTAWSAPMVQVSKVGGQVALTVRRSRKGGCQAQQSPDTSDSVFQREKPSSAARLEQPKTKGKNILLIKAQTREIFHNSGKAGEVNTTAVGKTLRRRRASEPPSLGAPADEATMYTCQTSGLQLQRLLGLRES
ncbi:hypothetical protein CRENBAI_004901 [Crenichthys baileyi]|uniref:Uncharacterized protein n=1 Tax=Crenichthys baileyi TaxID=28760 RepID=A0AAV9QUB9_9TELE